MATACTSELAYELLLDCDNLPAAGLETYAVLINYDDVSAIAYDEVNPEVITGITLKPDKKGYRVQQQGESFNGTNWEVVEGTYTNGFRHTLAFVVLDKSPEAKEAINKIVNGKFIAVIQNSESPDEAVFEVLGVKTGLKTPTGTRDYVTEETAGAASMTIASGIEPSVPKTFFDEDLAATKAKFEALYT